MSERLTRNLWRHEFRCKCGTCQPIAVDYVLVKVLQDLVDWFGKSLGVELGIYISSGHRCETHNRNEKGADNSKHILGIAADFYIYVKATGQRIPTKLIFKYLDRKYPNKYGIQDRGTFIHFDTRAIKWRKPFTRKS